MNTFIDNVAVLGIEHCLVDQLSDVFNPDIVAGMDDGTLKLLAAESEETQAERKRLQEKLEVLELGLKTCHNFQNSSQTGNNPLAPQRHCC
jgi:hypothetical protein